MFKWKDIYKCNVGKVDEQHRKLFEYGNEIYDIISLDDGYDHYDEIMSLLEKLSDYTIYHFNYEEKLMETYEFPYLEDHKIEHEVFVRKILDVKNNTKEIDANQKKILLEVLDFVAKWISMHILKSDFMYKEYLSNLAVK